LQQRDFAEFHKLKGIYITQYSPFGNQNEIYDGKDMGKLMDDPVLVKIGKRYCKTGDIRTFRRATPSLTRQTSKATLKLILRMSRR